MEERQSDADDGPNPLQHQCTQCSRAYKRPEHLQRHLASHSTDRPHSCHLCKASFQRSDVLKRHEKTCTGKRQKCTSITKRACDECIRSKRACSMVHPCSACQKKDVACTFSTVIDSTEASDNVSEWLSEPAGLSLSKGWGDYADLAYLESFGDFTPDFLQDDSWLLAGTIAHEGPNTLSVPTRPEQPNITLHFLEGFTRNKDLIASFDCGTESERLLARSTFESELESQHTLGLAHDPLCMTCHGIVSLIEEVVKIKARNSAVTMTWSPVIGAMCMEFFSPLYIRLYLELYWALWHPNVNIMHRPTFEPTSVKPILVGAMVIIGASVSPEASDRENAKMWFNAVEEAVFQDDDFCSDVEDSGASLLKQKVQSLQAAYIVCLFQNWNGTDSSKRRIRRFRYGHMVAVARDIGISFARHPQYHLTAACDFDWTDFVVREELIRVFLWIFLLDTAFVIFNNHPPRLAVMEMKQHFACSEACFQAPTRQQCWARLLYETESTKHTVSSLCEKMCSGPMSATTLVSLADLGPLNLFVITSAFHSSIFQAQQSFGCDIHMTPIRHGLDNWISIWNSCSSALSHLAGHDPLTREQHVPENMWKRTGFLRNAPEYWMLAKLIVEKILVKATFRESRHEDFPSVGRSSGQESSSERLLGKYDDTSMKQVNDLIAEFQKIML